MIPALEIEIDCCSIASWMLVRSASFILSNSSIRQTPLSASTSAPPSSVHSRVTESLWTDAVRPTAGALTGGVHGAGRGLLDVLEELRLGGAGVAQQ